MKALNWMNSVITKNGPRVKAVFILFTLSLLLTSCSVDSIPERIAGGIIREIIARDYYIWFAPEEEEDIPESSEETVTAKKDDSDEEESPDTGLEDEDLTLPEDEEDTEEEEEEITEIEDTEDTEEEEEDTVSGNEETTIDDYDDVNYEDQGKNAYYFTTLSSEEKKVYLEIYNSVVNMKESITLSSTDKDDVDRIFNLCMMDHPEIFYCEGYHSKVSEAEGKVLSIGFEGKFNYSRQERKEKEEKIRNAAKKVIDSVPKNGSDYDKAKYVFEWIIDNTAYDLNAPDNQNIVSVFLNKRSVCQGYTYAYKYLLNKLGIFCTIVYGEASGANHAWNLAKLDGTYCYIDVTWGDSSYRDKNDNEAERTSYNYLGCNSDILLRTHALKNKGKIPDCKSLDEYYYVKEAKYFTKVDLDRLKAVFDHESKESGHMFTIRASSEEVYNELKDTLFKEQQIFNLVQNADKITYIEDKDEYTLTFTV